MQIVELKDLIFRYPKSDYCLELSSFSCKAGECVSVIGDSGLGKSTLLHLIQGLHLIADAESFCAGSFMVLGKDWMTASVKERELLRRRAMGIVAPGAPFVDHLNMRDNLLIHQHLDAQDQPSDLMYLCETLGITDKLMSYPHQLSAGQLQRAQVARAFSNVPKLLLLDEAFSHIHPQVRDDLGVWVREEARKRDCGLISVTHDHESLKLDDRVYVLSRDDGEKEGMSLTVQGCWR